jgi:hypothetical protein
MVEATSMTIHEEAQDILEQLSKGSWKWMKVKRFDPDACPDLQARYEALMNHHEKETTFLIDVVKKFCTALTVK